MNLDEIKNRLASLNNKGGGGKKTDYAANFWKPKEGTNHKCVLYLTNTIKIFHLVNYISILELVNHVC